MDRRFRATSCAPPPTWSPTTARSTWSWPEAFFDYLEERLTRAPALP
ncbi:hypothetical protein ACWD3J_11450 [Streptomyces sp. NPDC002755]